MNPTRWIALCVPLVAVAVAPAEDAGEATQAPVAVFAELDGTWRGTFVGWDVTGEELYRIRVEQTYRTLDATTQEVQLKDTMPDGTVITGTGRNVARRRDDGSLELLCVVEKSNGDRVEHAGRVVRGPEGDEQIVWSSVADGREESFRESVREERGRAVYAIEGMGRYGATSMLMAGRYTRVP